MAYTKSWTLAIVHQEELMEIQASMDPDAHANRLVGPGQDRKLHIAKDEGCGQPRNATRELHIRGRKKWHSGYLEKQTQ